MVKLRNLPTERQLRKDSEGRNLGLLLLEIMEHEQISLSKAQKIANLLGNQWSTWSTCLPPEKEKNLLQNLSHVARATLQRIEGRSSTQEPICRNEIRAFLGMTI